MKRSPRVWGNGIEELEHRQMLASSIRSIDGTGNNLLNSLWGSAGVQLLREAAAAYADGIDDPATGDDRPSAREISNTLVEQQTEERETDDRFMAAMMYAWGQFIDHDLDLTTAGGSGFDIVVPDDPNDPFSTAATPPGPGVIHLTRSIFDSTTGTSTDNPREQTNLITAWLDGSMIYGSDDVKAMKLRTRIGGLLKTSPGEDGVVGTQDDLLPYNNATYFPDGTLSMDNNGPLPADQLFAAGDIRANENIELTSLHTLFVREHNRLARQLARTTQLGDEQIYQRARAMVIAELQSITYNQWLPTLLGRGALDFYRGYKPSVNPGIATEFSTALFRVGHSMLGEDVEFLDNDGEEVADEIPLNEAFFNPPLLVENGIGPILKYLASDPSSRIDNSIVDAVRDFLFGPPGAGGFDLASLNIQRGRDHGLSDYNTTRVAYGLPRVNDFSDITTNPEVAEKLESLYGDVDNIDLWVGALAEDHVAGSSVGPLIRAAISDQFERIRDGDRFWYQRQFSGLQRFSLDNLSLGDVISRNTEIDNLQNNVFVFHVSIGGTIFNDRNGDGRQGFLDRGLSEWTVQLVDDTGAVVDAVMTTAGGRYTFDEMELGTYEIQVVAPNGWSQTTRDRGEIEITRGMQIRGFDYGYKQGATIVTPTTPTTPVTTTPTTPVATAPTTPTNDRSPGRDRRSLIDRALSAIDEEDRHADENMMESLV